MQYFVLTGVIMAIGVHAHFTMRMRSESRVVGMLLPLAQQCALWISLDTKRSRQVLQRTKLRQVWYTVYDQNGYVFADTLEPCEAQPCPPTETQEKLLQLAEQNLNRTHRSVLACPAHDNEPRMRVFASVKNEEGMIVVAQTAF